MNKENEMYTKESSYVNYGKGCPGWNSTLRLRKDGREVAHYSYPNVHGECLTGFRDKDAAMEFRKLPDGPIEEMVAMSFLINGGE